MKHLGWLVLLGYLSICPTWAQMNVRDSGKKQAIDTCRVRVFYDCFHLRDTIKKKQLVDRQSLEIGDRVTHYYSVYAERMDSVMFKAKSKVSTADGVDLRSHLPSNLGLMVDDYFNNIYDTNQMTVMSQFGKICYLYTEPTPKIQWQLKTDTVNMIDYQCQKAIGTFRGRTWTVWYTPELPINCGPWKLGGLPGLILKASDETGEFSFVAIGIEQPKSVNIYKYNIPTIRSSRTAVQKLIAMRWQDPIGLAFATDPALKGWTMYNPVTKTEKEVKPGDIRKPYIPPLELE